jgi:hypothetical protein
MWIMAVDAAHRSFRHPVMIGLLELSENVLMAARTLFVDLHRLARHQPIRTVGMNLMAGDTGDRIVAVTALKASHVGRLIEMAFETGLIGSRGSQLGRVSDQSRVTGAGMQRAHPVTGFAPSSFETALGRDLDDVMPAKARPTLGQYCACILSTA